MGSRALASRALVVAKRGLFRTIAAAFGERSDVLRRDVWRSRAVIDEIGHLFPQATQRRRARVVATMLPLMARVPALAPRGLAVDVQLLDACHRVRLAQPSDLEVLAEVLGRESYAVPGVEDARTVIDLGSHIGLSLLYFRTRFPAARIIGVEADPRNWRLLTSNVAELSAVETRRAAATGVDAWRELNLAAERHRSSVTSEVPAERRVRVPGITLDSLVHELRADRVDLLKIDIEGAEWDVLTNATSLERVDAVVGEIHPPLLGPGVTEADVLALLADFELDVKPYPEYGTTLFRGRRTVTR